MKPKRVYNRNMDVISESQEITLKEALKILNRSRTFFMNMKQQNLIAPIAKDGNRYLYSRKDIINLRKSLIEYF
ncbi:MAG: hypothetical protein ACK5MH_09195 [Bacteroidales bacterium]